jgi:hypothetical protein
MGGKVSFLFALFSGIGCGFVMFFIGYYFGRLDGRALEREKRRAPKDPAASRYHNSA